jgi:PAS domain S-box-containing protein
MPSCALAQLIRRERDEILRRWLDRARQLEPARALRDRSILDEMPHVLDGVTDLIDQLAGGSEAKPPNGELRGHAHQRIGRDYDAADVVHEYSLLRRTIAALLEEKEERPAEDLRLLHRALDYVTEGSVRYYTEESRGRERAARDEAERSLARLSVQHTIARLLAEESRVDQAAAGILKVAGEALGWDAGAIWLLDRERDELKSEVVWCRSGIDGRALEREVRSLGPKRDEGLIGRVWSSCQPVSIADLHDQPALLRRELALALGLKSAFASPIALGEKRYGVLELWAEAARPPDPPLVEQMIAIGRQLALYIERTRAIEALRQSEARKSAVLTSALDCVISMDHLGRIQELNPAAERTFGYAREQAIGRDLADTIIPPSLRDAHRRGLARYLQTGEGPILRRRVELTATRSDGSEFPVELTVVPIPGEQPPYFTAYVRDLSERVRAEHERDLFLAALGHDLRTPLSTIQLAAQLLLRQGGGDARPAERIVANAHRMGRLIQQLLDFARAQLGHGLPVDRHPIDLVALCREVLAEADTARREIVFHPPAALVGCWDRDRLGQVVQNLVWNAIQHGAADRPIELTLKMESASAVLEVHNQGAPIPPASLPNLFDPFSGGPRRHDGLGLGLYIVRQIVSAHGGAISVSSTEDRGTTFRVTLPLAL